MRAKDSICAAAMATLLIIGVTVFLGGSASGADDPGVIDEDVAAERALTVGDKAEAARLHLHQLLLKAVDLERKHEVGPPRHTLDPPGDYETARVEEIFPYGFLPYGRRRG